LGQLLGSKQPSCNLGKTDTQMVSAGYTNFKISKATMNMSLLTKNEKAKDEERYSLDHGLPRIMHHRITSSPFAFTLSKSTEGVMNISYK
jgi:hypothetical protein